MQAIKRQCREALGGHEYAARVADYFVLYYRQGCAENCYTAAEVADLFQLETDGYIAKTLVSRCYSCHIGGVDNNADKIHHSWNHNAKQLQSALCGLF